MKYLTLMLLVSLVGCNATPEQLQEFNQAVSQFNQDMLQMRNTAVYQTQPYLAPTIPQRWSEPTSGQGQPKSYLVNTSTGTKQCVVYPNGYIRCY